MTSAVIRDWICRGGGLVLVAAGSAWAQTSIPRIDSLLAQERYDDAAAALAELPPSGSGEVDRLYYLGRIDLGKGASERAESLFERAIRADPASAEYRYWAGRAAHERMEAAGLIGKARLARRAMSRFREAVARKPDHVDARTWLTQYLWQAPGIVGGDRKEALRQIDQLRRYDAVQAERVLGGLRWDEKNYAAAEEAYRAVLEVDSADAQSWYMLGRTRHEQADMAGAVTAYERALSADSAHLRAMYYLGRASVTSGNGLERAESIVRRFIRDAKPMGDAWIAGGHATLGRLLEARGQTREAADAYRSAISIDPKHDESNRRLRALGATP